MSNSMKTPNEYQLYDMSKGNNDQKWQKKGNMQKGKEMNYVREDKGEYIDHQQYQKHPNRKNYSSYSNKNQGEEYDNKMIPGQKGNNQTPNYKKNQKVKKENANEYPGNSQMDDNQNDKDEFQAYKKTMTQQNQNREGGGFNTKGNKSKYGQHQNGNYNQGQGQGQGQDQNMNWDKSQLSMVNTQQQNQYQTGGYYDKKAYINSGNNSLPNQLNSNINPNSNPYANQFNPQSQNQGQYNFRSIYQNEPKQNILSMQQQQQGKKNNVMNSNGFNISNSQQVPGEYMNKNQGMYQYCNAENNIPSNMSASINQDQDASNNDEDNYIQQPNQFMYNKGYRIHDPIDSTSFISGMSDSMMPGSINSNSLSIISPGSMQQYPNLPNMANMPNMNRSYQQDMYMQQPFMNQGNLYMNDPQMMKGMNRNIGMMNMPPHQMPLGMDQSSNQMFPLQQMPYGMNQNNNGVMTKTKKKSSKKIAQSPQEGMNSNLKGGMKLHYNNNSGKYYKGSHSTQGVKNTIPNFNGANLSFLNMNNSNNNNPMMQNPVLSGNQIIPMQINNNPLMSNQGNQKTVYKQKRNMNNNSNNNPYRNVTSDNTIGSGIVSNSSKSKANDYYSNTTNNTSSNSKSQQNQYFKNQQSNRKYQQKFEDYNTQGGDYDQSISNQDPNESSPNFSNAKPSFYVKIRLEENKEAFIEIKQNEDPIAIATTLKQYKISENQMTLVYNKILETLNIMDYVMNVQLNGFDIKQLNLVKQTIHPSPKQISEQHNKRNHYTLPFIQIEQLNDTFAYETIGYDNCLSDIRPDYSDIKHSQLLNISQ